MVLDTPTQMIIELACIPGRVCMDATAAVERIAMLDYDFENTPEEYLFDNGFKFCSDNEQYIAVSLLETGLELNGLHAMERAHAACLAIGDIFDV
jgi:hypothetical protein